MLLVVETLTDGLLALHSAGVVHRDLKPSNLLYVANAGTERGEELLIGDLGIAKDLLTAGSELTMAGGTPGYMSPEQNSPDGTITPAADVYGATVMITELLTGRRGSDATKDIESVLGPTAARGIAKDPADRHQEIREWHADVVSSLTNSNSAPLGADDANPADVDTADVHVAARAGSAAAGDGHSPSPGGKGRVVGLIVALGIATIAVVGISLGLGSGGEEVGIDGPVTVEVGETVFFRPELPDDAISHEWTVGDSVVTNSDLTLTPSAPGELTIRLEVETADGVATGSHVVTVAP